MLINVNKVWCRRFLRKFKEIDASVNDSENTAENKGENNTGSYGDFLSEPESAEMEVCLANTSKVWRNHTKKLMRDKIQAQSHKKKLRGYNDREVKLWRVNQSMIKTLANMKEEMIDLESHLSNRKVKKTGKTSK